MMEGELEADLIQQVDRIKSLGYRRDLDEDLASGWAMDSRRSLTRLRFGGLSLLLHGSEPAGRKLGEGLGWSHNAIH